MDIVADSDLTSTHHTRDEFRRWEDARQDDRRFERIDWRPVQMPPDRSAHALVKAAVWRELNEAIRAAGVPCKAYPDGMTVEVADATDYLPDALVNAGPPIPMNDVAATNPVIVVEVETPSTARFDRREKLAGYFRVASIQHCLMVRVDPREVWHARRVGDRVETAGVTDDTLLLAPPGLALSVASFFAELPPA